MRESVLYIAVSLDGYIADVDGKIDWLTAFEINETGYNEFISTVDSLVMGRVTYDQLVNELSPGVWPYPDQTTFVATRQRREDNAQVQFVNDPIRLVRYLKVQEGKDIWIVGGAQIVASLLEEGLIDKVILTFIPKLIGRGIPLFPEIKSRFDLVSSKTYGPMVEVTYQLQKAKVYEPSLSFDA